MWVGLDLFLLTPTQFSSMINEDMLINFLILKMNNFACYAYIIYKSINLLTFLKFYSRGVEFNEFVLDNIFTMSKLGLQVD